MGIGDNSASREGRGPFIVMTAMVAVIIVVGAIFGNPQEKTKGYWNKTNDEKIREIAQASDNTKELELGKLIMPFGKHAGLSLCDLWDEENGYYKYMAGQFKTKKSRNKRYVEFKKCFVLYSELRERSE